MGVAMLVLRVGRGWIFSISVDCEILGTTAGTIRQFRM